MTQTTKRLERTEQFKVKDVEMRLDADGNEMYGVAVYPRFRNGWSQYTRDMFLWGDDPKATFQALGKLKDTIVSLKIISGKVKGNKQDDGQDDSYFWNVVGIAETTNQLQVMPSSPSDARPTPQTPPAQPPSATEKPQEASLAAPPAAVPSLGGIGHESDWAGPFYYDITEAAHQARVQWGQAVNLAVEAIGVHDFEGNAVMQQDPSVYFADVEVLANRFYPLIRKGPSPQDDTIDPETLPWDAPQPHQEATDGASALAAQSQVGPVFPPRLKDEVDYTYFFRAARAVAGLSPTQALAKLGVGNWNNWLGAGHTLEEALEKLKESKP